MVSWKQVSAALENNKYKWRTIRGVAKELKATEDDVMKVITENASEVIKSSIPAASGEVLYTTRIHYRRKASLFDKIASSLTSTVTPSGSSGEGD
jgi:hypothetical protein